MAYPKWGENGVKIMAHPACCKETDSAPGSSNVLMQSRIYTSTKLVTTLIIFDPVMSSVSTKLQACEVLEADEGPLKQL